MDRKKIKDNKFNRFVVRNSKEIKKILMLFMVLFILNFLLFIIDIYSDSANFFFHWPLGISAVIFLLYSIQLSLWKKRHLREQVQEGDTKKPRRSKKEE
jgi:membrane protein implicated in regulation of membrane protease activity